MKNPTLRTVKIKDLGRVVTGSTPPTKTKEYFGSEYPFITPTDIQENTRYVETSRFISNEGREFLKNRLLPQQSICYVCIGATIGKMCMTNNPSFTNQQINSIVVDKNNHNPFFVYYLLKYHTRRIRLVAGGAASPIVKKSLFSSLSVKVPNLQIQTRIGFLLSSYDDFIENNRRRIQLLEEMARALYREWFVHFRFPGHEEVKMMDSELGEIPEGWKISTLGEECHLVIGQSPKSEYYNENGEGLPFHQGVKDFADFIPNHRVHCTFDKRVAEQGDILFSVRAPVGRINLADTKLIIGRGLHAIRHKEGYQSFLLHQLKNKFYKEDMMGSGTVYQAVTKSDVMNVELLIPPIRILKDFEETSGIMVNLIIYLIKQNQNLSVLRDLLLPKLVSGKIDVSDLRIEVPLDTHTTPKYSDQSTIDQWLDGDDHDDQVDR